MWLCNVSCAKEDTCIHSFSEWVLPFKNLSLFFLTFFIPQYLEKQPFLNTERWNSDFLIPPEITFSTQTKPGTFVSFRGPGQTEWRVCSWPGQEEPALQRLVDKSRLLFLGWGVREKILKREFPPPGKLLIPRISSSTSLGNSQQSGATAFSASSSGCSVPVWALTHQVTSGKAWTASTSQRTHL